MYRIMVQEEEATESDFPVGFCLATCRVKSRHHGIVKRKAAIEPDSSTSESRARARSSHERGEGQAVNRESGTPLVRLDAAMRLGGAHLVVLKAIVLVVGVAVGPDGAGYRETSTTYLDSNLTAKHLSLLLTTDFAGLADRATLATLFCDQSDDLRSWKTRQRRIHTGTGTTGLRRLGEQMRLRTEGFLDTFGALVTAAITAAITTATTVTATSSPDSRLGSAPGFDGASSPSS
ncbi:hypothetical protein FB45DRAFT_861118 [Roridomyces roridus]|uniref:Uncharacterized protein n=1 Tax=Roridomyces roridus TaxID=1738132 RepID=A0AAD7CGS6_9AGAR|nr:hypothetical protein FB45DRAFT_861118 [Roridomyces roridus]